MPLTAWPSSQSRQRTPAMSFINSSEWVIRQASTESKTAYLPAVSDDDAHLLVVRICGD
jgi:hypothetical protein